LLQKLLLVFLLVASNVEYIRERVELGIHRLRGNRSSGYRPWWSEGLLSEGAREYGDPVVVTEHRRVVEGLLHVQPFEHRSPYSHAGEGILDLGLSNWRGWGVCGFVDLDAYAFLDFGGGNSVKVLENLAVEEESLLFGGNVPLFENFELQLADGHLGSNLEVHSGSI